MLLCLLVVDGIAIAVLASKFLADKTFILLGHRFTADFADPLNAVSHFIGFY